MHVSVMILTFVCFLNQNRHDCNISENKKKLKRLVKVLQSECRQHQRTPPNQLASWGKINDRNQRFLYSRWSQKVHFVPFLPLNQKAVRCRWLFDLQVAVKDLQVAMRKCIKLQENPFTRKLCARISLTFQFPQREKKMSTNRKTNSNIDK